MNQDGITKQYHSSYQTEGKREIGGNKKKKISYKMADLKANISLIILNIKV